MDDYLLEKAELDGALDRFGDDREGPLARIDKVHYLTIIKLLHVELMKLQTWIHGEGLRVAAIFEGRDAAGKGGAIRRFQDHTSPSVFRPVSLAKPDDRERGQWYYQRYVAHLPGAGEVALFDRSWYNRAMVERVMGFCTEADVRDFLRTAPLFEHLLVGAGTILFKYFFLLSKEEQARRFAKREIDPLRQWKLSPVDLESQDKWDDYARAERDMFAHTSSAEAPWVLVEGDDKKRARINIIRHFLSSFDYPERRDDLLAVDSRIVYPYRPEEVAGNREKSVMPYVPVAARETGG